MNQRLVIILFCFFSVLSCRTKTVNRTYTKNRTYTLTGTITQKETGRARLKSTVTILGKNELIDKYYSFTGDTLSNDKQTFCISNLERGLYLIMITGEGYDPKTITVETRIGSKDTIHIDVITSYSKLKFIPGIYNGVCPICGKSDSLREFAYGLPTSEGLKNRKRKNQISGGCIISDKNPKFRCVRDSVDFQ